jgi:hypothetical protein
MWPSLSTTKPDPSACCDCPSTGLPKTSTPDCPFDVEVIWTTPGPLRPVDVGDVDTGRAGGRRCGGLPRGHGRGCDGRRRIVERPDGPGAGERHAATEKGSGGERGDRSRGGRQPARACRVGGVGRPREPNGPEVSERLIPPVIGGRAVNPGLRAVKPLLRPSPPSSRPARGRAERVVELPAELARGESSSVMSAPPISSPLTKTCGIVGQSEIAESSVRIAGSGRMSTAVIGAPAFHSAWSARSELPHAGRSGVPS